MIALKNVTKAYPVDKKNRVVALQEVNLEIPRGAFLVITGRSGSGKTTLLNLVAGLTRPTTGRVLFEDADWQSLPDHRQSRLRNHKIGFVFQFPSLLPFLTALENVALPGIFDHGRASQGAHDRARTLLRSLALGDRLGAYPRQLSAGQQQRLVIARALLNEPEVLLADEPTSDLDEQTESEIMELFRQLHASTGITIVLVTHSTQLIRYGSHSIKMADGRVQPCSPLEK
jgi:putative ABC transport system ATP-binding protein/lipoprotein-releasing system ATP-binding protein